MNDDRLYFMFGKKIAGFGKFSLYPETACYRRFPGHSADYPLYLGECWCEGLNDYGLKVHRLFDNDWKSFQSKIYTIHIPVIPACSIYLSSRHAFEPGSSDFKYCKSLDYEIHPCISPCGPAIGCSNLLPADLVPIEALGNDDSFLSLCAFWIGLKDKAKALH